MSELWITDDRAQIGVQSKNFAKRQERPSLRLLLARQLLPFRPADGAEEDRVGGAGYLNGFVGQGLAMSVDGDAADIRLRELELVNAGLVDRLENGERRFHHLGTDSVARKNGYLEFFHGNG